MAAALARRRNMPVRTLYRDLHALEASGFPITTGDGARWKLIDHWEARIPFPLPLGQLLALHLARKLMGPLRATRTGRDFEALCARLIGYPLHVAVESIGRRSDSIVGTSSETVG